MKRPAAFSHRVRIYWEDTDAGGIVFYANYLKYFERARTEWLRSLGFGQQAVRDRWGLIFVVVDTQLQFRQPARLDDELTITAALAPAHAPRVTLALVQAAQRGDTVLVDSHITLACVQVDTFKPQRIPPPILQAITAPSA